MTDRIAGKRLSYVAAHRGKAIVASLDVICLKPLPSENVGVPPLDRVNGSSDSGHHQGRSDLAHENNLHHLPFPPCGHI